MHTFAIIVYMSFYSVAIVLINMHICVLYRYLCYDIASYNISNHIATHGI